MNKLYGIMAVSLLLSSCGPSTSRSIDSNSTASSTDAAASISLGKTGKANGVDYTVTAVTTPNHIGPAGVGIAAEKGETFVVVAYTLKNTGDRALPLMERPALNLVDAKGQSYAPDQMASPMAAGLMDDASGMASDLNPKVSAKTKAAWKVDKASFDKATWHVVVAADPALTFALK